jgi:predicted RNA-binding protein
MARTYWLDLFTIETWQEFVDHGRTVSGFSEAGLATVKRMKPGDYLLCYVTRISRWVGVLEVTGEAYFDESPIWKSQTFPSRVPVRTVIALEPQYGVPVLDIASGVDCLPKPQQPESVEWIFSRLSS